MNRDGSTTSIWQDGLAEYVSRNEWSKLQVYDVLIIGGGITGLTTALQLQESGKKCVLAEAHNIAFGTSGGTTGHLNTLLDTPYWQVAKDFGEEAAKLLASGAREAIAQIESYAAKYNIDCDFAYKTAFVFADTDDEAKDLEDIKEGNEKALVSSEWSKTIPVPIPFKTAIRVERQAQAHIPKYLVGLARAFEDAGGIILQHCFISGVEEDDIVTANSPVGTIRAYSAVYATHLPPGINIFSFRCAPYRSYAMAFTLKSGEYPDALVYDMKDPYHYYRTHTIGGKQYIIAGGNDHKTGHNDNTGHVFTELEAYLRHYFDIDEIAYRWSSQYYESVDGLPYIGKMPGRERVYAATGYIGNGLVFGTLAGKVISTLINEGKTPYEELFDPSRIKIVAGFAKFVKENADVIAQFVEKKLSFEQINALVDIAPGQATLAAWNGQKIGIYKDGQGRVYAVDPVCPHAKCTVAWNTAEKTWDCPCHGARYAPDGTLLGGPAPHGLRPLDWEVI